jgi:hypothetical protein
MGVRTSREIELERVALKMLRGDFEETDAASGDGEGSGAVRARRALTAARR